MRLLIEDGGGLENDGMRVQFVLSFHHHEVRLGDVELEFKGRDWLGRRRRRERFGARSRLGYHSCVKGKGVKG